MKILIVAATEIEIMPLFKLKNELSIADILVTGIGIAATAYMLGRKLTQQKFDLVINAGIAGAFNKDLAMGEVVNVRNDYFYDIGAEDGDNFIPFYRLSLYDIFSRNTQDGKIFNNSVFYNRTLETLKTVSGITVNTVHGNVESIKKVIDNCNPDIETMESAAFMYVCQSEKVPFLQIRAISNYVSKRDKSEWNIDLAIQNLNRTIADIIKN